VRVAYLCHRIPYPPDKGDKIRAFHQLRAIARRHEVDLFTLVDDERDVVHRASLERYCRKVTALPINSRVARLRALPFLLTSKPLTIPYFYSAELNTRVRRFVLDRSYDRIFVYCSAMAQYVEWVDRIPVVTDLVDVDSDKWTQYAGHAPFPMSIVYRREGHCLREYERKVCERSSSIIVTTEREAALVRDIYDRANVHVITNGVDTTFFSPAAVQSESGDPTIIFTGDMSYFPNEEAVMFFAQQVLPIVRRSVPGATFFIVGRNPGVAVQNMHGKDGVRVTGFVPDVRTYFAKAHVAVAPFSIAAGIQNKILEALAYGLPVVATSRTVQGLSKEVAAIVGIADTVSDMAEEIIQLLSDPESARRRGIEGRIRVTEGYRWDRSLDQLVHLLEHPTHIPKTVRH
jgi:polysaccharide biosynthesis protein PslH